MERELKREKDTMYKTSKKTDKARKRDRSNVNKTTNTVKKNNCCVENSRHGTRASLMNWAVLPHWL
jgi:hypothetical protein